MADYALALYDVSLYWSNQPNDAIRTPLSLESAWTLSIEILNDVRNAIESGGKDFEPPSWQWIPGDDQELDRDPPPEHSLNPPPPAPEPPQDSSAPTPVDSSPAPVDGGVPAGGASLDDDDPVKVQE